MDQIIKRAAIYDKLENQPHLQDLIKVHYMSSLMSDHDEYDKEKLHSHILNLEYELGERPVMDEYACSHPGVYDNCVKSWKMRRRMLLKTLKNVTSLKTPTPYPSLDCFLDIKERINDLNEDAHLEYPNSKRRREKYKKKNWLKYVGIKD